MTLFRDNEYNSCSVNSAAMKLRMIVLDFGVKGSKYRGELTKIWPKPLNVCLQLSIWHLTAVLLLYSLASILASFESFCISFGGLSGSKYSGTSSDTGNIVPLPVVFPCFIRRR